MTIYYQDDQTTVYHGDCIEVMRNMPENSVDSIVTDPPYGLSNTTPEQVADTIVRWVSGDREHLPSGKGFMGKAWDGFVPPVAVWDEAMRVLKPGGHVLSFAGTRTMDLMTLGLRLAGFEIRDSLAWLYGSGFPKSHDVSKGIDKMGGSNNAFKEFAKAYAQAITESGMTHSAIDKHLGIKSSSCYWAREDHRGGMPPRRHWGAVKQLLSLDDSLDHLYDEAEREVIGVQKNAMSGWRGDGTTKFVDRDITAPATDAAKQWSGWGTALKPANEPIVMARKPFKGTVAANVLEHGTGAINIDACRVGDEVRKVAPINAGAFTLDGCQSLGELRHLASLGAKTPNGRDARTTLKRAERFNATSEPREYSGRWPANVILDEHMAGVLDEQSGVLKSGARTPTGGEQKGDVYGLGHKTSGTNTFASSEGGASRFFYVAKAPKRERPEVNGVKHATVKPLTLMRYLVRMVTPPGGIVLDPFAGSGTTIEAALLEGFQSIGIELTDEYLPLIQQRIQRQRVGAAMSTKYHVCDHPELLVKDETCFLCDQIDGQTDALNEVEW